MIIIARIIEAWRDARIFEFPTEPRGKIWHFLKYPQYGLLIGSSMAYFLILHFGLDLGFYIMGDLYLFGTWSWHVLLTVVVIGVDAGLAYFVFEWFLPFFRKRIEVEW